MTRLHLAILSLLVFSSVLAVGYTLETRYVIEDV